MILQYNDADRIAEAFEFLRTGGDEEKAAAFLGCRVEDLPRLGLPVKSSKQVPTNQDQGVDLWAADRAQEIL